MNRLIYSIYLLFITLLLVGCNKEHTKVDTPKKEIASVKVKTLHKEPIVIWLDYSSKVEAYKLALVISRVDGELIKQYFRAGQKVQRGDLLFGIDKSSYEASVNRALAKLQKDRASLDLAKAEVLRYKPLVDEQLAPMQKLEQLIASQKELEAVIKADEVVLKDAKLKLSYCDIKAPITGRIDKEHIKVGNFIKAGSVMAKIIDASFLQINFYPDTKDTAQIQKYKSKPYPDVEIFLRDNPAIKLKGSLEYISPFVDKSTGTVPMRAKVANPKREILPGSFITLRLIVNPAYLAVAISPKWIYQDQEGEFIYIVEGGVIKKYHFKSIFSNEEIVILPDSAESLKVIVQPIGRLSEGVAVTPIEDKRSN